MMITLDKQVIKTIHFNDKKGKTYKERHVALRTIASRTVVGYNTYPFCIYVWESSHNVFY